MGEIRIRIDDEALMGRLGDLARARGHTVEEEVLDLVATAVANTARNETLYEAAVRISAMTPKGVKQIDSVEILRELRDN